MDHHNPWDIDADLWTQRIRSETDLNRRYLINPTVLHTLTSSFEHTNCSKLILDAGCGEGSFSYLLARIPNANVVAFDLSFRMCEHAIELLKNEANVVNADVLNLPFSSEVFDVIVANMLLTGIEHLSNCLAEFVRILKSNGTLIFSILNPSRVIPNDRYGFIFRSKPTVVPVFNYTQPRMMQASLKLGGNNLLPSRVPYFHRQLSHYIKDLRNAGFVVLDLIEPSPDIALRAKYPQMAHFWDLAPFLVVLARRNG